MFENYDLSEYCCAGLNRSCGKCVTSDKCYEYNTPDNLTISKLING